MDRRGRDRTMLIFFCLEKYRSKTKTFYQSNINGTSTDDAKTISPFCCRSRLCKQCKHGRKYRWALRWQPIYWRRGILKSIDLLKNNKSPGTDGLVAEFLQWLSSQLAPFLLQVFNESVERGTLPPSLTQGLITLIPKSKKDILFIYN